jgi:hypothetical protein
MMMRLKFAFRTLFKTPFVTIVAIVALALGIGANTAIFSLFNQMLLRPLPVQEPGRLSAVGIGQLAQSLLYHLQGYDRPCWPSPPSR